MIPALFVKELKERKTLILFGLILCLFSPVFCFILKSLNLVTAEYGKDLNFALSWMGLLAVMAFLFPLLLGSSALAGEVENKTLPFLLSMPYPRWRIWWSKFFANWTILHVFLLLFLLTNPATGDHFFMDNGRLHDYIWAARYDILWRLLPCLFPSLILAMGFTASSFAGKESTAAGATLLIPLFTAAALFIVLRALYWDLSVLESLTIMILLILAFLFISLWTFLRGELLENLKSKFKAGLFSTLLCLVLLALGMTLLYFSSLMEKAGTWRHIFSLHPLPDGRSLLASVAHEDSRNDRLWEIPLDGRPARHFSERYVQEVFPSPDGKTGAFLRTASPEGPIGRLLGFSKSEICVINLQSGKARKVLDLPCPRREDRLFWLDNGRLLFVQSEKNPILDRSITTLTLADSSGRLIRQVVVPAPGEGLVPSIKAELCGSSLFLLYTMDRGITIRKFDFKTNRTKTVFEKSGLGACLPREAVSPDEKGLLFYLRAPKEKLASFYYADFASRREILLPRAESSYYEFPGWLGNTGKIMLIVSGQDKKQLLVLDSRTGKIIFREEGGFFPFTAWNAKTGELAYGSSVRYWGITCLKVANIEKAEVKVLCRRLRSASAACWIDRDRLAVLTNWDRIFLVTRDGRKKNLFDVNPR